MTKSRPADVDAAASPDAVTLPPAPPGASSFATRAELLRARASALPQLHEADVSMRTMGGTALSISIAATLFALSGMGWGESDSGKDGFGPVASVVWAAICGVPALLLSRRVLRRTRRAREIANRRFAWERLPDTPEARALPPGDLTHDLRDLFDARTRADGSRHILYDCGRLYGSVWETRLLYRAIISGSALWIGGLMLAFGILGATEGLSGFIPAGALVLAAGAIQFRQCLWRSFHASGQTGRAYKEVDAWREATGFHGDLSVDNP